jgi:shikimate kinase
VSSILQGVNLYLIGMMGAGKTTVGRLLAQQLGYKFLDTDTLIEKVAGDKPITQIFAEEGEATFRQIESKVLGEVCAFKNLVISTGGGIILQRENWSYLQHGLVVWLNAPVEVLYSRLAEDTTRPLLQDADPKGKLRSLLEQRQALYSQADIAIPVSAADTPEELATKIMEAIPSVLKKPTSPPNSYN